MTGLSDGGVDRLVDIIGNLPRINAPVIIKIICMTLGKGLGAASCDTRLVAIVGYDLFLVICAERVFLVTDIIH